MRLPVTTFWADAKSGGAASTPPHSHPTTPTASLISTGLASLSYRSMDFGALAIRTLMRPASTEGDFPSGAAVVTMELSHIRHLNITSFYSQRFAANQNLRHFSVIEIPVGLK